MPRSPRQPPRWYFSLRSPYSWLALHDLSTRHTDVAARIEWRPFFEPDARSAAALEGAGGHFPYVAMSRAKHLYILGDVRRLAAARGLVPAWPIDRDPRWEVPHLAWFVAEAAGRGRDYVTAVTRARWVDGRDICDPAVVAAVGDDLGLDGAAMAGAADDDGLREAGVRALVDVDRDGVFGVPFFVAGRERFWGVDRLDAFCTAVRGEGKGQAAMTGTARSTDTMDMAGGAGQTEAPGGALLAVGAAVPPPAADAGHAGGCG